MCKKIVYLLITLICVAVPNEAVGKNFTLVIDAGHGGNDAGARGAISREKDLTLKFALAFGRLVERNCPDVRVIYTRKTDRFIELYRRAEIANQNKADLFISVHINALPKGHYARGFQTYTLGKSRRTGKKNGVMENLEVAKRENAVILMEKNYRQTYHGYDPNSPESDIMFEFIQDKNMEYSVELAKYMQRYVCQATGRQDMGAHQDNLAVLRLTSMPGCLIELGFISSRDEERYMNSSLATDQYARGIYNAFAAYRRKHGGSTTVPYIAAPKDEKISIPSIVPESEKRHQERDSKPKQTIQPPAPKAELAEKSDSVPQDAPRDAAKDTPKDAARLDETKGAEPLLEGVDLSVVTSQPVAPAESAVASEAPVFKVQILIASTPLKIGDRQFKGLTDIDYYKEGGIVKYTVGASENYNEIYRLRRSLLDKFPQAFIIAFKGGQKMNVQAAIAEFKSRRMKK